MGNRFLELSKIILRPALDLIFPPVCLGCHDRIGKDIDLLCEPCLETISPIEDGFCDVCGSPLDSKDCEVCWDSKIHFDFSRSVFRFDGAIRQMIHELKYNGLTSPVGWLAERAANYLKVNGIYKDIDVIMAVPLHAVRKRERGFNQSELIAREIANRMELAYCEPVKRRCYTESQTHLTKTQRMQNLKSAFVLLPRVDITGKHILLIDDVFTTGSTVNEIARILRTAKPAQIAVLTVARA
ncbi:MAG: hypothetical protein CVU48_05010 [Candidatus Cloacimonetes bacterium HGW-Cloacimonetes-1]|jgi:ComF family protein|nr:MAG: hypothetical protein CVU48_05010 [Candidatus Cloacimonetes bacterium HGW-Cloacimonetes-1]